jgi:hypothetical protein
MLLSNACMPFSAQEARVTATRPIGNGWNTHVPSQLVIPTIRDWIVFHAFALFPLIIHG